ncbi:MBL fold metallo-hydrolase [Candidatus Fermentibacteria bacterium]|nr:MBL fold metallo-hydrolase [Candidatus Fermentibacteria bacterium]
MKITPHGAARAVTGSQHLVEACGRRILLDCGMFQGHRQESEKLNRSQAYDPASIDAVVLSHAHIDHSGNLPTIVKNGFRGTIVSTFATRDLSAIMLPDSAHIQRGDIEYLNRKRRKKGLPDLQPLYEMDDVMKALELFVSIPYGRPFDLFDGVKVRFLEAGHILGSSQVELELREGGKTTTLLFSGDLGRKGRPILRDPDLSARPDFLLMESTYGGRLHEPPEEAMDKLSEVLNRTSESGGKVIVPSFSVGRTQEVLYYLHELLIADRVPQLPIYVDSPLSFNATEVYMLHPECFDARMRELVQDRQTPFNSESVRFTQNVEDSKALNHDTSPMIIISASGMCENGRILHHLKNNVGDPRSTILVVGFMAANTLGRRLVERAPTVSIFGESYERKARVEVINGFSAHADSEGLYAYASVVGERAGRITLVHGEEEQALSLRDRLREGLQKDVLVPRMHEVIRL